jgi:glycosyltransferase involved in cell wall biosynthesis
MTRKISFVCTARNEPPAVLAATIDGLLETTSRYERELVVIDDGSETPVECTSDEVTLIRNPEPIGVSRSRRMGGSVATGSIFVWLDAHMSFAPDWLDRMLEHVDTGSLLCSAYWDYAQSSCYSWGADFAWCSERDYSARRSPGFAIWYRRRFPGTGAVDVPMIVGACYMLRRSSYEALAGISPLFRVWGVDEQDLSARAWLTGLGVKCVTDARVGHLCRPGFPYPVRYEHLEFNQIVMLRCLFEETTVQALVRFFEPIPRQVQQWLDETDLAEWRTAIQSRRQIGDAEFLRRFVPAFFWGFASREEMR